MRWGARALLRASLLVTVSLASVAQHASGAPSLHRRVNEALERASLWLFSRQEESGAWGSQDKVHPVGRTTLVGYALLHAGLPRDHEGIVRAYGYLVSRGRYETGVPVISTYEASCAVFFLHALGGDNDALIQKICAWIADGFDSGAGLWGYPEGTPDLSNTGFAAMALEIGQRHGYRASPRIWQKLVDGVVRLQDADGSFRYRDRTVTRGTMTHAGLLCLELARRSLGLSRHPARVELAARKGHAWCDERYTVTECPFGSGFHDGYYPYYMWGMARYAIVHERKEIGGRDWYREGAEELLRRQEKNGSWGNLDDTALCMLFLRKAALTEPAPRPVDPDEDGTGTPEAKSSEVWRRELPPKPKFAPRSDVPSIRSWLVLGPFTETGVDDTMLVKDHFPVARIKPREGASVGGKRWALYTSPEDVVDLDKAAGDSQYSAVYAATWLHAGVDTEILLWVASDDGMRVFLEGKELLHSPHHDWSGDDRYALPVRLEAGAHLLLVKVSDVGYYCRLRVRVTDLEGIPAPGVEARPGPWAARKR